MPSSKRSRRAARPRLKSGWLPQHLALEDESGRIHAVAPLYLKNHSYGEYVFDHGWAASYERVGGRYYPKLQCAVPFTPVTGRRLLLRPDAPAAAADALIAAMVELARRHKVSSLHVTFPTEAEWRRFGEADSCNGSGSNSIGRMTTTRTSRASSPRSIPASASRIHRERRDAMANGIEIEMLTGDAIKPGHWDMFFRFYMSTSDRKWGSAYLTREFFDLIGKRIPDRVLLVMAKKGARYVAGALNLIGADTLYGRNWGCLGDYPFLHFEACYYRAIDFAIERGLKRVEAGAQGQHKIQRGYLPCHTYSAHWIRDANFSEAVADFLKREARALEHNMEELEEELSPFKRSSD